MEKRKPSTRNRGEPPLKKRQSSPPPPQPPQRPKAPVEEGLPVKLKDGQPLPTLAEQQDAKLSIAEFQSIAERFVNKNLTRRIYLADGSLKRNIGDRYRALPSEVAQ